MFSWGREKSPDKSAEDRERERRSMSNRVILTEDVKGDLKVLSSQISALADFLEKFEKSFDARLAKIEKLEPTINEMKDQLKSVESQSSQILKLMGERKVEGERGKKDENLICPKCRYQFVENSTKNSEVRSLASPSPYSSSPRSSSSYSSSSYSSYSSSSYSPSSSSSSSSNSSSNSSPLSYATISATAPTYPTGWLCTSCKVLNRPINKFCIKCKAEYQPPSATPAELVPRDNTTVQITPGSQLEPSGGLESTSSGLPKGDLGRTVSAPTKPVAQPEWQCLHCTYMNKHQAQVCDVCNKSRGTKPNPAKVIKVCVTTIGSISLPQDVLWKMLLTSTVGREDLKLQRVHESLFCKTDPESSSSGKEENCDVMIIQAGYDSRPDWKYYAKLKSHPGSKRILVFLHKYSDASRAARPDTWSEKPPGVFHLIGTDAGLTNSGWEAEQEKALLSYILE